MGEAEAEGEKTTESLFSNIVQCIVQYTVQYVLQNDQFYWLLFQPESRDGEEEEDPQQVEEQMTQEHLIQRPFYST